MITASQVREIALQSAGEPDDLRAELDADEAEFAELGYDSLAVLEVAAVIGKRLGIDIPDDVTVQARTPAAMAEYVNARLAVPAGRNR